MSANHGMTRHTERYSHAPTRHPAIGDNTWFCHEDGQLVVDVEIHDKWHDELAELKRLVESLTSAPPDQKAEEEPSAPSRSTRSTVKAKVQESPS